MTRRLTLGLGAVVLLLALGGGIAIKLQGQGTTPALSPESEEARPVTLPSSFPEAAAPSGAPTASSTSAGRSQQDPPLSFKAQEEVKRCFGSATPVGGMRPILGAVRGGAVAQVKFRNVQVELADGGHLRANLFEESNERGEPVLKIRFFNEDAEGLAEPIQLPAAYSALTPEEAFASFESSGKVSGRENAWHAETADGKSLDWVEEDGQIRELHVMAGDRSLGCGFTSDSPTADCDCRR